MAVSGALLRLRRRNEEDEPLPSTCESTVGIKRFGTRSLVAILTVDRGFNGSGFMKPIDRAPTAWTRLTESVDLFHRISNRKINLKF
jgi:hypothetical protein